MKSSNAFGFTLAELLVAVAIMGLIAAFTVPKIINANNTPERHKALGKAVASDFQNAYSRYRLDHAVLPSTGMAALTPYMHFVKTDSTTVLDSLQTVTPTTMDCVSPRHCLVLQNGGRIIYVPTQIFANTAATSALYIFFDPDGKLTDNTANNSGKSLALILYYDGTLKTWGSMRPNTYMWGSGGPYNPNSAWDPSWWNFD